MRQIEFPTGRATPRVEKGGGDDPAGFAAMPLNRKNVTISLPTANDDASPYDLTDSGAFREGELEIDRRGLRISGVGTPTAPAPTPTGAKRAGVATPTGAKRARCASSPRGGGRRETGREISGAGRSRAVNLVQG